MSENNLDVPRNVEAMILDDNVMTMAYLQTIILDAHNLTVLGLSNIHLYSLTQWTSYVPRLLMLNLDNNHVDYLSNHLIRHTINLQWLSLVNNKLEVIETGSFVGLTQLNYLNMSHNRIYEIKRQWCYDMPSLRTLDMTDNTITVLWDNLFDGCSAMRELHLTSNHVAHVYNNAMHGLQQLNILKLDHNHLHALPMEGLKILNNASLVDLSSNYFHDLPRHSFSFVNTSTLKLNSLNLVRYVYDEAFCNMPNLLTLEMNDSPALAYIDQEAFINVSHLSTLSLRNNNLITLQNKIITSLPSLRTIEIDGNDFSCDCMMSWIYQNVTNSLNVVQNLTCHNSNTSTISHDWCAPRVAPLTLDVLEYDFGESTLLQCRSTGYPIPTLNWMYSQNNDSEFRNVSSIHSNTNNSLSPRVALTPNGDLIFNYLTSDDVGLYKCEAENQHGSDYRVTSLHVTNADLHVIMTHTSATTITVTWKRERYRSDGGNNYHIIYKAAGTNASQSHTVNLRPHMRSYTANHLEADKRYEFCIMSTYQHQNVVVNCTFINTQERSFDQLGVFNARSWIIGIGIAVVCMSLLMSCSISMCVKRYNVKRKRRRHDIYGDNSSRLCLSSVESISDMSPITYENKAARLCEDEDDNDDMIPVFDTVIDEEDENIDDDVIANVSINKHTA